jgi:hypothetical protein
MRQVYSPTAAAVPLVAIRRKRLRLGVRTRDKTCYDPLFRAASLSRKLTPLVIHGAAGSAFR